MLQFLAIANALDYFVCLTAATRGIPNGSVTTAHRG